jgi:hypothetical protein
MDAKGIINGAQFNDVMIWTPWTALVRPSIKWLKNCNTALLSGLLMK